VGKAWAIFFGVNMALCGLLFVIAPAMGWWLPPGRSTHSGDVDLLFYVILVITGFFFVLTEAILVAFLWSYGSGQKAHQGDLPGPIQKIADALKLNNQHRVEMAWTIVPAAILLYIAFAQVGAWARVKFQARIAEFMGNKTPLQVDVTARQFEWRVRYPSSQRVREWIKNPADAAVKTDMDSFARTAQADDVHVVNELHLWKDHPIKVALSTRDVLHSFNLPQLRVKQDALPGKVIPVWFTPTDANTVAATDSSGNPVWQDGKGHDDQGRAKDKGFVWEIACAELCGWGHWRMIGRVYVHESEQDFLDWLVSAEEKEHGRVAAK
jgi:cytochrome c oxidase subunit 2